MEYKGLLDVMVSYGANGVYLIFIYMLWKRLQEVTAKYEALLTRTVESLAIISKELEDINDGKKE